MDSSSVCDSGIMGPATKPWSTRNAISSSMDGARPHRMDAITNRITLIVNSFTAPKRCVSQPVSGTEIALATPKLVMTHVPCEMLTPRSPEIEGNETLAIEESSTFMKVASDSDNVPNTSAPPFRGARAAGAGLLMSDLRPADCGASRFGRPGAAHHDCLWCL